MAKLHGKIAYASITVFVVALAIFKGWAEAFWTWIKTGK